MALALKPHVVIATPGRLVDHLENTKGFSLRTAKYLVLDEADRMLGMVRERVSSCAYERPVLRGGSGSTTSCRDTWPNMSQGRKTCIFMRQAFVLDTPAGVLTLRLAPVCLRFRSVEADGATLTPLRTVLFVSSLVLAAVPKGHCVVHCL